MGQEGHYSVVLHDSFPTACGRRKRLSEEAVADIVAMYGSGATIAAIMHRHGVKPGAIYYYVQAARQPNKRPRTTAATFKQIEADMARGAERWWLHETYGVSYTTLLRRYGPSRPYRRPAP